MNNPIEPVKSGIEAWKSTVGHFWILRNFPRLFALTGIVGMGWLDYAAIKHLVETWPPRTFLNGATIFCFIPFLTLGVLAYVGLLWMVATGELNKKDND